MYITGSFDKTKNNLFFFDNKKMIAALETPQKISAVLTLCYSYISKQKTILILKI